MTCSNRGGSVLGRAWVGAASCAIALGCGPVSGGELSAEGELIDPGSGGAGGETSLAVSPPDSSGGSDGWGSGGSDSPGKGGAASTGGAAGSAGAAGEASGGVGGAGVPTPPKPSFSDEAKSFCKKFGKICGFASNTYDDAFACSALYDSYSKKQRRCVEDALDAAKSDPSKKNCRAASGGAYCEL